MKLEKMMSKTAGRLIGDSRGAAILILAIALPAMVMTFSVAVDGLQTLLLRQKLQTAADATTLAVAKRSALDDQLTKQFLEGYGKDFLAAQVRTDYEISSFDIVPADASASIRLTGKSKGFFSKIFGVDFLDFTVTSAAAFSRIKVEMALVLDNSRSINDTELEGVRSAAKLLIDELIQTSSGQQNSQSLISLIPFSGIVRLPASEQGQWWIDGDDGGAPNHRDHINSIEYTDRSGNIKTWNPTRFDLFDQISDHSWAGCVESRPYPLDVTDASPVKGDPSTWFLPYFAFDIPDTIKGKASDKKDTAANDWLSDDGGSCTAEPTQDNFFENVADSCRYGSPGNEVKSNGKMATIKSDSFPRGPNYYCTMSEIQPLTGDKQTLYQALDGMVNEHVNVTDLTIGLMWGWRALTPEAPLEQSTSPVGPDVRKILVLMTDGANASPVAETRNYGAYGFPSDGRLNSSLTKDSKSDDISGFMNKRTQEACENAKKDGIEIISINYGKNTDGVSLLKGCASKDEFFFKAADTSALESVFKTLAQSIGSLRLTQ